VAYRLKNKESFSKSIKRIVLEQIDEALQNLKPKSRNKDEAIHDARVCIKKIRAALRLSRDGLGIKLYEYEDKKYREVARKLSESRDGAAMLEIIDKLVEHFADPLADDPFRSVRLTLRREKKSRTQDRQQAMKEAAQQLRSLRKQVHKWPKDNDGQVLIKGLHRTFKGGRRRFAVVAEKPGVRNFHQLRKQVKHLEHAMEILRPIWSEIITSFAEELNTLGGYLSEDHDLAILGQHVSDELPDAETHGETEALAGLIDQRRSELEVKAKDLGAKIFAETPRAFAERFEVYLRVWRNEVSVD